MTGGLLQHLFHFPTCTLWCYLDTVISQSSIQVPNLHACADQKICESLPSNNFVLWSPSTPKVSPRAFCKEMLPEVCTKLLLHRYIFLHIWLWGLRSGVLPYFCNYLIQHQKTFPLFHFIHVHNHRQSLTVISGLPPPVCSSCDLILKVQMKWHDRLS